MSPHSETGPCAPGGRLWRSDGVLIAEFRDGVCAYDLLLDRVHLLGPAAARLLDRLPVDVDDLLHDAGEVADLDSADAEDEVRRGVEALVAIGVMNRTTPSSRPEPVQGVRGAPTGRFTGASHDVLDHVVAFRSGDRDLLDAIDEFIGAAPHSAPPTVHFDVDPRLDGGIDLYAAELWEFPTRSGFFAQLPGVVHDFAARSDSSIVLHAGAVRTPDGRVIVLPGASEHGKSTLVAALVQAGCDYLGEEMTGVRAGTLDARCYPTPLALDDVSRAVLGLSGSSSPHTDPRTLRAGVRCLSGDVGPVVEVVLPVFAPDEEHATRCLGPVDALKALLAHATNLHRAGDAGLRTLCDLAMHVPVVRVVHGDSPGLARSLISGPGAIGTSPVG